MKNVLIKTLSGLFLLVCSMHVLAEISVIVHPNNASNLNQKTISKLYLGKSSSFPGGGKAVPMNILEGHDLTNEFNKKVLGKSDAQLKSYWSKLVFTGKGTPPKEVSSEADMIQFVSENQGAIGYVSSSAVTPNVKVIATF